MSNEAFVRKHLVCWYSPQRQGATRESLAENPRLIDLSGNGRDLNLKGFDWTASSVISSTGGLQFDGNSCYGICDNDFKLRDFTLVYKRGALPFHTLTAPGKCFCRKGKAFTIENTLAARTLSNYAFSEIGLTADRTTHGLFGTGLYVVTPFCILHIDTGTTVQMKRGGGEDSASAKLLIGCETETSNKLKFVMEEFMLFDRELNTERLQWVFANLLT